MVSYVKKVKFKVHCMFIVIPDAANVSEAKFGKEKERKTKDEVEEKEVPSPDRLSTTFPLRGVVIFCRCEPTDK